MVMTLTEAMEAFKEARDQIRELERREKALQSELAAALDRCKQAEERGEERAFREMLRLLDGWVGSVKASTLHTWIMLRFFNDRGLYLEYVPGRIGEPEKETPCPDTQTLKS